MEKRKKYIVLGVTLGIILFVILLLIISNNINNNIKRNDNNSEDETISQNYDDINIENIFNNYGKEIFNDEITFSQYGTAIRNEFLKHYFLKKDFLSYDDIKAQLPQTNFSCHYVSTSIKETGEGEIICSGGTTNNGLSFYSVNLYFNEALYDYFKENIDNGRKYTEEELLVLGFENIEIIESDIDITDIEEHWDLTLGGYFFGKDGYLYDYSCDLYESNCIAEKVSQSKVKKIMQLDCTGKSTTACSKHSIFIFVNGENLYNNIQTILLSKDDLKELFETQK